MTQTRTPHKSPGTPLHRVVVIREDGQGAARCYDAESGEELTDVPETTEFVIRVLNPPAVRTKTKTEAR